MKRTFDELVDEPASATSPETNRFARGVPSPVARSYPAVAEYPFEPVVTSL